MQLVTSFWCIYQKWGFLIQGVSEVSSPTLGLYQIHGKFHAFSWLIYPKLRPIMLPVSAEHSELNMNVGELNKHTIKGIYLLNQFNCTAPHPQTPFAPLGASARLSGGKNYLEKTEKNPVEGNFDVVPAKQGRWSLDS